MRRSEKKPRKPADRWPAAKPRPLGVESIGLWVLTLCFWARTAVWFYHGRIRSHDEMNLGVLVIDVLCPLLATLLTLEWWKQRRQQGKAKRRADSARPR